MLSLFFLIIVGGGGPDCYLAYISGRAHLRLDQIIFHWSCPNIKTFQENSSLLMYLINLKFFSLLFILGYYFYAMLCLSYDCYFTSPKIEITLTLTNIS